MASGLEVSAGLYGDVKIWRYMDVGQFLQVLHSSSLYFARKHEVEDKWEGVHPQSQGRKGLRDLHAAGWPSFAEKVACEAVFNCWHENEHESVAMWNLYTSGREGVAIQTTVGHLFWLVREGTVYWPSVRVHRVSYVDYDQEEPPQSADNLGFLTCKRRSYAHEREIRAIIQYVPGNAGMLIRMDLERLIQRIIVAPTYPDWAIAALQEAVGRACISAKVESSDLLRAPEI